MKKDILAHFKEQNYLVHGQLDVQQIYIRYIVELIIGIGVLHL